MFQMDLKDSSGVSLARKPQLETGIENCQDRQEDIWLCIWPSIDCRKKGAMEDGILDVLQYTTFINIIFIHCTAWPTCPNF